MEAEYVSEYYSGINLDKEVTNFELSLGRHKNPVINSSLVNQVMSINLTKKDLSTLAGEGGKVLFLL